MANRKIIADSSTLMALSLIDKIHILELIYTEITITPEIQDEFVQSLPQWVSIEKVSNKNLLSELQMFLI